jgi:L-ascorbate metabolism protein UlaG (beta-lactamase superfamily)
MSIMRITHIGGPTALIEVGGWRILTDPTFDAPGRRYNFGWGTSSKKLTAPSIAAEAIGTIDAVLLSHDHHEDNLDPAGRALLPNAGTVVTTVSGAKRLAKQGATNAQGLAFWQTTTLEAPGRTPLEITATPCRHGPPLSRPLVGDVIGFALRSEDQQHGAVWISGDTVLYDGVKEVPQRLNVGTAILHLGGVRFPISGPFHYTMTAKDAIELTRLTQPHTAIPIHYEGWKHFREGRDEVERALQGAPADLSGRFRWVPIGDPVEIET